MPEGRIIRRSRTSRSAVSGTHRSPSVLKNTRRLPGFFLFFSGKRGLFEENRFFPQKG